MRISLLCFALVLLSARAPTFAAQTAQANAPAPALQSRSTQEPNWLMTVTIRLGSVAPSEATRLFNAMDTSLRANPVPSLVWHAYFTDPPEKEVGMVGLWAQKEKPSVTGIQYGEASNLYAVAEDWFTANGLTESDYTLKAVALVPGKGSPAMTPRANQQTDIEDVRKALADLRAAYQAKDVGKAVSFYDPSAEVILTDGQGGQNTISGLDDLRRQMTEAVDALPGLYRSVSNMDIRVTGDTAVARFSAEGQYTDPNNQTPVDLVTRHVVTLKRTPAGWRITRLEVSPSGRP